MNMTTSRFHTSCKSLAAAALISLAVLNHAAAHAFIDHTDPVVGSTVKQAPAEVRLSYTQGLEPAFSRVQVFDASGKEVDKKRRSLRPEEQPRDDRLHAIGTGRGQIQGGLAGGERGHASHGRQLYLRSRPLELAKWTPRRSCGRSGSAGSPKRAPPCCWWARRRCACSPLARASIRRRSAGARWPGQAGRSCSWQLPCNSV